METCPHCKTQIKLGATVCTGCGAMKKNYAEANGAVGLSVVIGFFGTIFFIWVGLGNLFYSGKIGEGIFQLFVALFLFFICFMRGLKAAKQIVWVR